MGQIALSILTPAVPSRLLQLKGLCAQIEEQIGDLPVEHLVLLDNKRRSVGEKRDALLRAARGDYVAFVDDDDGITGDYVLDILAATKTRPDVITFCQSADVNGKVAKVEFRLGNPNEAYAGVDKDLNYCYLNPAVTVKRNAWHVCAWKRHLAILSRFPQSNYGEDWAFAEPLCRLAQNEVHIPKVLHFYRHSSQTTEAPAPV